MERVRATWTDERLDDLSRRVESGFNRMDEDLRALRLELGARIDSLQRTMLQVGGATIATILAAALSLIATGG
jgi:hypothetical protein